MKNYLFLLLIALLIIPTISAITSITNCDELQAIENDLAGEYVLVNDINCSMTSSWNGGGGFIPITDFTGTLDGQYHKISNLFINVSANETITNSNVAIFSRIDGNVIIKNLVIENPTISGTTTGGVKTHIAVLVAEDENSNGNVQNIKIIGANIYAYSSYNYCGIMYGELSSSLIQSIIENSNLFDCYDYGGGFLGKSGGMTLIDSYISNVTITGHLRIGTFTGEAQDMYRLYSKTKGSAGFGLPNCAEDGIYYNSAFGGNCGDAKTEEELKTQETYSAYAPYGNYDFDNIWYINNNYNEGYPCLRWEQGCVPEEPQQQTGFTPTGQAVYEIMNSSGAGLGIFMNFMGQALPVLLLLLSFIGIVFVIGYSIVLFFKHSGTNQN